LNQAESFKFFALCNFISEGERKKESIIFAGIPSVKLDGDAIRRGINSDIW